MCVSTCGRQRGTGSGVWGGGSLGKEARVDFNTEETGDDKRNQGERVTFVLYVSCSNGAWSELVETIQLIYTFCLPSFSAPSPL